MFSNLSIKFKNLSIKNKLRLLMVLTSAVVLLPVVLWLIWDEVALLKQQIARELFTLSTFIAHDNHASLLLKLNTHNQAEIKKTFAYDMVLQGRDDIRYVSIFDEQGQLLFNRYTRQGLVKPAEHPLAAYHEQHLSAELRLSLENLTAQQHQAAYFHQDHIDIFKLIIIDGQQQGTLYLQADNKILRNQIKQAFWSVLSVLLLALWAAYWLAGSLQHLITAPFYRLLKIMETVTRRQDYSVRLHDDTQQEINQLVQAFNKMICQIENRDKVLNEYREHLEDRVKLRTKQLNQAKQHIDPNKETKPVVPTVRPNIIGFKGIPKRILIVDDNPEHLTLLQLTLHSLGFIVEQADSGHQAISKVTLMPPDMVIIDLVMPKMDGYETCQQLRQQFDAEQLPIIAVSANTQERHQQAAKQVGCNAVIAKPIDNDKLLDAIASSLSLEWIEQVHDIHDINS